MRKKANVSQLIRDQIDAGVHDPSEIVTKLAEQGIRVAAPYVSVVKWKHLKDGGGKKNGHADSMRSGHEAKPNGEVVDYVLSCGSFDAAKSRLQSQKERMLLRLISKHHGADGAMKA